MKDTDNSAPVVITSVKPKLTARKKVLFAAAVAVVLAGVVFGGYKLISSTVLRAAGEESLGANATIDLPQLTTSQYFKIAVTTQQSVDIRLNSDACTNPATSDYSCYVLADGWRLEMTEDSTALDGWKVIANAKDDIRTVLNAISYASDPFTKRADDAALLQPGRSYYFRLLKSDSTDEEDIMWDQQGPVLLASTKNYPQVDVTGDTGPTVSWTSTEAGGEIAASGAMGYGVARSNDPALLVAGGGWLLSGNTRVPNTGKDIYSIDSVAAVNGYASGVTAGTVKLAQADDTTAYYVPVLYGKSGANVVVLRVLGPVQIVTTKAVAAAKPFATVTVNTGSGSAPWNAIAANLGVVVGYDQSVAASNIKVRASLKSSNGVVTPLGLSQQSNSSAELKYSVDNLKKALAVGDYTLVVEAINTAETPATIITKEVPLKLTAISPKITASYADKSLNKGDTVKIVVANAADTNTGLRPSGKISIVNRNTGKSIKDFTLLASTANQTLSFIANTAGSYAIDVKYTPTGSYFTPTTITLAGLVVADDPFSKLATRCYGVASVKSTLTIGYKDNFHISGDQPYALEDSIQGVNLAIKKKKKSIDIDVMMTKDGVLVASHAWVPMESGIKGGFKDTAGKMDPKMRLSKMTLAEVRRLKHKDGYKISTLEEIIAHAKGKKITLLLELKNEKARRNSTSSAANYRKSIPHIAYLLNKYKVKAGIIALESREGYASNLSMARSVGFYTRVVQTNQGWKNPTNTSTLCK